LWIEKLHQVDKPLPAQYRTTKNLQERTDARVSWVVHQDTTTAIINQMLNVERATKRKFTGIWDKDRQKED
jgi:hypothetical protein